MDFAKTKSLFHLPDGVVYLDGNSLGPMPKTATTALHNVAKNEWGEMLIQAWNKAGWMEQPKRVGNQIAKLIGAPESSVAIGDTLSIKVYQAVAAALSANPNRRYILTDNGNFPTDIYMANGLCNLLGGSHEVKVVNPEDVSSALNDDVAVLMLTEVDYRTGRKHNMNELTAKAHKVGALTVWDLAHSTGALEVDVRGANVDFAVGCTYKYLNGGPGAPAFIYVAPHMQEIATQPLQGWLGHNAPFDFALEYAPSLKAQHYRVGTPSVLQMATLEEALKIWDHVDMSDLRKRSLELADLFIEIVTSACPDLLLVTPSAPEHRGSQVSFRHAEGYAIMQALIELGVIGDFRAPNILRFGITPLYLDKHDITKAAECLVDVIKTDAFNAPKFQKRGLVT